MSGYAAGYVAKAMNARGLGCNMSINDMSKFDTYIESTGNIYSAVMAVVKDARNLSSNGYTDTQALSYVLSGEVPKIRKHAATSRKDRLESMIKDELCEVDDPDVCGAVEISLQKSTKKRYLVYDYQGVLDEPRQARIRVLTRIIWDKILTID